MSEFAWGGFGGKIVDRDWKTGDDVWGVGDLAKGGDLPGGLGIVAGVIARRRVVTASGGRVCRFTYAVALAE